MIQPLTMTGKRRLMPGAPFVPAAALGKGVGVPAWVLSGAALDLDFAEARGFNSIDRSKQTPDQILTYTSPSPKLVYGDDGVLGFAPHNLLTYSEQFDNAAWVDISAGTTTKTANAATAPDGTQTAELLVGNNVNTWLAQDKATGHASTTKTFSVYLRADSPYTAELRLSFSGGTTYTQNVSVTTAWQRFTFTQTFAAGDTQALRVAVNHKSGNNTYIWGAQLCFGSAALTYVPTTSAAKYNLPIDHDPLTPFASRGVLIEEQRTNLLTYSEQFDNAAWTKSRATVTANAIAAPDGTTTADKLVPSVDVGVTHRIYQSGITHGVLRTYAYTCYLKAGEYTFGRLLLSDATESDSASCRFNLSDGTLDGVAVASGTFSAASASIEDVGSGWYRCTLIATCDATEATVVAWVASGNTTAGANSFAGDTTSGIYVWGAQLEAGAFPTSYIPTVASQVTRAADQVSILTSAFAYNAAEGSLVTKSDTNQMSGASYSYIASFGDGTANERIVSRSLNTDANFAVVDGGAAQAAFNLTGSIAQNVPFKLAYAYKVNDFAASLGGGGIGADASGTIPTVTTLKLGADSPAGATLNGHINRLTYFPTRKSDAELQALST